MEMPSYKNIRDKILGECCIMTVKPEEDQESDSRREVSFRALYGLCEEVTKR